MPGWMVGGTLRVARGHVEVGAARLDDAGVTQGRGDVLAGLTRLDDDVDLALARAGEVGGLGLGVNRPDTIGESTLKAA